MIGLIPHSRSPLCKVGIGIPSGPSWPADFGLCLMNQVLALLQQPVRGYGQTQLKVINRRASLLPKLRQEICDSALKAGLEWLVFIDSDQTFPESTVHRLIQKQFPVIGCNIATKSLPASSTARNQPVDDWPGGVPVYTLPTSKGVEKVWRLGCGVMCIHLPILQKIPKPWFQIEYRLRETSKGPLEDYVGEDWYFCEKLEAAGIPIYVDHDLSKEIGHVGSFTFGHEHVKVDVSPEIAGANIERKLSGVIGA